MANTIGLSEGRGGRRLAGVTVLEVIRRSTVYLERHGVESPRLTIELLLAHVLRLPRLQLYLQFERELTEAQRDSLRELVRRRGNREPLQHLVGTASFCGLEVAVNRDVLIPRPETELLAERGGSFLTRLAVGRGEGAALAALDFGTGSGCLAVALAARCPTVRVWAVDTSAAALAVARANAARHGVDGRILFCAGDGFAALPPEARFDLIVANPPYIPSGDIAGLPPEVRDYEPRQALDGGPDGLKFFRCLAVEGGTRLRDGGRLMAEFGDGQERALEALFGAAAWDIESIVPDDTGRPRILIAHRG
jgi:release factor glutamine methyltransferase